MILLHLPNGAEIYLNVESIEAMTYTTRVTMITMDSGATYKVREKLGDIIETMLTGKATETPTAMLAN